MDDANTYDVTNVNVYEDLEERLTEMVELQAWLSGRPEDELWGQVAEFAEEKRKGR